jgi:hypothetical protein
MKKTMILLTMIGLNSLSASTINAEKATTNRVINILIKHDFLVEREVPQARKARKSRVARMGRNSRGVRPERVARMVYKMPEKEKAHLSATALIKKSYLSKLSK